MIRVLLVDDHAIVRAGLRALLGAQPDIEIVGEASDGAEALVAAARARPQVALLDLSMPGASGLEALRRLREQDPALRVLVLSMHAAPEYVRPALRLGADGYVVKGAGLDDLLPALREVAAGRRFVDRRAAAVLDLEAPVEPPGRDGLALLTPREREVLQLVAEGHTNREIGARLGLSPKTIDTHRTRLMQKLDLHDAPSLTRFAIRCGLVDAQ